MSVNTLPTLTLTANGRTLDLIALKQVRVQQTLSLPTQCELVFFQADSADQLTIGTSLRLTVDTFSPPLFVGEVTAVEWHYRADGELELRVRGYDVLHQLRKRQPVRAFVETQAADLARELVADLGIEIATTTAAPLHELLIQHGHNDFDLLQQTLATHGIYFTLRDDTLHLLTLTGLTDRVELALGESLHEASVELNSDRAVQSVAVSGWDPLWMEMFEGVVSEAQSGRRVTAQVDGRDAVVFGEMESADSDQSTAIAQAIIDQRTAAAIVLNGVAEGDPALRPGTIVAVAGLDNAISGDYPLCDVLHTIDAQRGYLTTISSQPPQLPTPPRAASALIGVVTQVADPQGLGRVRVSYPSLNGVESGWMQVMSPAAGVNKGLVALPDIDDNVLVLCLNQNPTRGIVLGGIYGPFAPYADGVDGGAITRYSLRTPNGQLVQLDDSARQIRIENSEGSYVEMEPDKVRIHATTDLEIAAPGHAIVIKGDSIDFQRG